MHRSNLALVTVFLTMCLLCESQAGILGLFNEWNDELEGGGKQENGCKEKRNIKHGKVSLMDIEKDAMQMGMESDNLKTKRCPRDKYVGIKSRMSERAPIDYLPLVKRESEDDNVKMCSTCRNQPMCKLLKRCDECNKYCKHDPSFTNNVHKFWNVTDSPTVSLGNRMAKGSKNDDIFSKTLYPISTYRQGETKDIICKIVGITDTSDIETVTIWVTTFSNNPPVNPLGINVNKDPRKQENLSEQKGRQSQQNNNLEGDEVHPEVSARFGDLGDDTSIKQNPDLIEGPPPFFRSENEVEALPSSPLDNDDSFLGSANKDIIVQPKELQSDESTEDETEETFRTEETGKSNDAGSKGGFLQNLLKSRQGTPAIQTKPMEISPGNNLPGDRMSQLSDALQEVKTMVQNIQEEAKKASEKRLLGSPHIPENPLPSHVIDNMKKVNKYLADRSQDLLDSVGATQKKLEEKPSGEDNPSDITKKMIVDMKKMPQFVLNRFKDTLEGFEEDRAPKNDVAEEKIEDQIVGIKNEEEASPMTPSPKTKLEKYLADIKEKRQKKYSPEKYSNLDKNKQETVGTANDSNDIDHHFLPTPHTPTKSLKNPLQADLLKEKIKQYVENLKKQKSEAAATATTEATLLGQPMGDTNKLGNNREKIKQYMGNLKKTKSEAAAATTEAAQLLSERLGDVDDKIESNRNLLRNKLKNYMTSLKAPKASKSIFAAEADRDENIVGKPAGGNVEMMDAPPVDPVKLESRSGAFVDPDFAELSSDLGKIVQSKPQDIFFLGDGIKLPLQIKQSLDGTMDLSVDLDKLCSCKNTTCPTNHTAIEETVGTILEKEAELKEQLSLNRRKIGKKSVLKREVSALDNLKQINNDFFNKLEHEKRLNQLLSANGFAEAFKKPVEHIQLQQLLHKLNLPSQKQNVLKQIEDQANSIRKSVQLPKNWQDINDNLLKMTDPLAHSKIDLLEGKLKGLNEEVDKFQQENGKLLAEESKKIFGVGINNNNNKVYEQEANILSKVLSWLSGLTKVENL